MKRPSFAMHMVNVGTARVRANRRRRENPEWADTERAHLMLRGQCAACTGTNALFVHHIEPIEVNPRGEHDLMNLLTLCMGPLECLLRIGCGGDWDSYNPRVVEHSTEAKVRPVFRPEIERRASMAAIKRRREI